jgi:hypothetical protein
LSADTLGVLAVVFAGVPDFGMVWNAGGGSLNLHKPGVVRIVLDAALGDGWNPASTATFKVDGWRLLSKASEQCHNDRLPLRPDVVETDM